MATDSKDIVGSILVTTNSNRMDGKVKVIAVGEIDLSSHITVKQHNEIHGHIYAYSDNQVENGLNVSQRKSKLRVLDRENLPSNIVITPNGSMQGVVEVLPPPRTVVKLSPIADAFIREGIKTLNYGTEQTMLVGYSANNNERYRSLIQFDLSVIPSGQTIEKAVLKMYNNTANQTAQQIGIFSAYNAWTELGVTWNNQPYIESLTAAKIVGDKEGFIEFNTFNQVNRWYNNEIINNGFIIKALDEAINQYLSLYTREVQNLDLKPVLEITYFDNNIQSTGRTQLRSEGYIRAIGSNAIRGSFEIPTYHVEGEMRSHIRVRNPQFIECSMVVSRPDVLSNITVTQHDNEDINSHIQVRQKNVIDIVSSLIIYSRPNLPGQIKVKTYNDLTSNMVVRQTENNDIISSVLVFVNRDTIEGSIQVKLISEIPSAILVIRHEEINIQSSIVIIRPTITANIKVRRSDKTEVYGSMTVREIGKLNLSSNLFVNRVDVLGTIKVTLINDIQGSITVRPTGKTTLTAQIIIPFRSQIPSKMTIIGASKLHSHIFVVSGYLKSNIRIPFREKKDLASHANIRVKFIKEIECTLRIHGILVDDSYVFIM